MLELYQMVDKNFMPHMVPTAGQLFIRKANDKLALVCGVVLLPDNIDCEYIYPASIQLDTNRKEEVPNSEGMTPDSILTSPVWRVKH